MERPHLELRAATYTAATKFASSLGRYYESLRTLASPAERKAAILSIQESAQAYLDALEDLLAFLNGSEQTESVAIELAHLSKLRRLAEKELIARRL